MTRPLRVLLGPAGSAGDVHPFVGLGKALRDRGHEVIIITSRVFQGLVEGVGLPFAPVGTVEEFRAGVEDPALWHPTRGFPTVMQYVLRMVPDAFAAVDRFYEPGRTVMASAMLGIGARLAQEKLGVPMASVHLQPAVFMSAQRPPVHAIRIPQWLPLPLRRLGMSLAEGMVDRAVGPGLNEIRRDMGLPPVRKTLQWVHSPQLVIGLFPAWYAQPQSDWPPRTHLTGFPLYDEADITDMPEEAKAFLEAGDAPIVFTPGSANIFGREFFEAGAQACARLGKRGILLTRHGEQVPEALPSGVRHFDYIPFSVLLPQAAALVHHGGIGTLAQGMAAGLPHLVMPISHDQPDNASRLEGLGVGRSLRPKRFTGPRVARVLGELLGSGSVATCCAEIAGRMRDDNPLEETCDLIEGLAQTEGAST